MSCRPIRLTIPDDCGGLRLDQALAQLLPEYSRSRLQSWIKEGLVTVEGEATDARRKVWGGEAVMVLPQPTAEELAFKAQDIPLDIVFEDAHILVIDKPAGRVVHPAAGNWDGTLLNALLHHVPQLESVPRAGIVHRLDKDTSGLLVVAKTIAAQTDLVRQLQARTVKREYRAIVWGIVHGRGKVDAAIGRDPHDRKKMAVVRHFGKPAVTHFEALETFSWHSYVRCLLETGRTHQIRVHMASIKAPLVGDPLYGPRGGVMPGVKMSASLAAAVKSFKRQALHAARLGLVHPATGEAMQWHAELPADMKALLAALRADAKHAMEAAAEPAADDWWEGEVYASEADEDWDEDEA
ncbi:MAG: 23S rRNA pseudouridine(1911/1915/1917) synthase RluD [Methylophilaceae bacterium]|nr:23S rRNA pseudouridine(1911/1915/1917) synthase RluD [Methylophilaceae bacterium]